MSQGNDRLEEARAAYSKLPKNFPYRTARLGDLDRRVKQGGIQLSTLPTSIPVPRAPEDVARVLQQLSSDDLREIAEQEGGTAYINLGKDEAQNRKQREHHDRLAATGLARYLSDAEIKAEAKKEKAHYDYGVMTTDLYNKTREFIFTALTQTLANAQFPR